MQEYGVVRVGDVRKPMDTRELCQCNSVVTGDLKVIKKASHSIWEASRVAEKNLTVICKSWVG
jgi:hypothetical protein